MEGIKKQEDRIQQEIVQWYNNTHCKLNDSPRCLIFHIPNQNQYHLVSIGVLGGVSDLIVIHRTAQSATAVTLFVEVKTLTGSQQPNQIKFQQRITELGYQYVVVRSVDEFKQYINTLEQRLIV